MKWLAPTLGTRGLSQDIRYGLRALKSAPGFTAVALISLTLGIGVATAAFSELNGFVLRDVPGVRSPGELVTLAAPASYPNFQRYRERSDLFAGTLAYVAPVPLGISLDGHTERMWGHLVTPSYFPTLGVHPALGRFLTDEDAIANVVVSYRFWQNRMGSDPSAELWLPVGRVSDLPIAPELAGRALDRHDLEIFHVIARLRPGVPAARAEAALDAIARQLEQENGDPNRDQKGRRVALLPGGKLLPVRKQDLPLLTGFMAVLGGMILLIASANVANMLLARAADRRREIAVRLALGAGRARLIRQLLAESMMIASVAGVLGFLLATLLMHFAS